MPSKAQRAASRQARLSRRRRRGKGTSQTFQAGPTQPTAVSDTASEAPSRQVRQAASVRSSATTSGPSISGPAPRTRRRSSEAGTPLVGKYLGRELRQIGIITSLIAVILAGLTLVLG